MAKIRRGFVSNSSSSSFIISKDLLTEEQLVELLSLNNHLIGQWSDQWDIYEDDNTVRGFTSMNNGRDEDGLEYQLKMLKFPIDKFKWEHD